MENAENQMTTQPEQTPNSKKGLSILLIIMILILGAVVVVLVTKLNQQKKYAAETQQVVEDQKASLTKELKDLIGEYGALKTNNDSMNMMIGQQQEKIKRLLQLRASNLVLIDKYKRELGTLREVLKSYIVQVDSLNTRNQQLVQENTEVKTHLEAARQENIQVNKEKNELSSKVQRASVITTSNIVITELNKRGHKERRLTRVTKLRVCFTLRENAIATSGEKEVYIRLTRPDGAVIANSTADMFSFQGQQIVYTASREVEYDNKDLDVCIFWDNTNHQLIVGDYTVDIFTDGNLIGTSKFTLKKR